MRSKIFISILTVIVLLTGCKKISSVPDPQQPDPGGPPLVTPIGIPVGTPVSKTIGSAGGSLKSPDGKMELNFPAGALTSNTAISIQPVTNFCPGGIDLAYHLMPDNITFSKPVTLSYHYTDDDVDGSHPYFLFIAYQDSLQTWKADYKNRNVDTIAKTVSLGISHFSIWSLGVSLDLFLEPFDDELYENETREITVTIFSPGSLLSTSDPSVFVSLPQRTRFPDQDVVRWTLVGSASAIGANGTLSAIGGTSKVTYTAPSSINNERKVQVSAEVDYAIVFFNNGRVVARSAKIILFKDITLLPSIFNYSVEIHFKDPDISGLGAPGQGGQVYEDKVSFDLSLQLTEDNMGLPTVVVLGSNFDNHKPSVTPISRTYSDPYSSSTWEWIPDDIGMTNITDITLTAFDPADSTIDLQLVHKGAVYPSFNWSTSLGISRTQSPLPFKDPLGIPQSLHMKLEHKDQSSQFVKIKAE